MQSMTLREGKDQEHEQDAPSSRDRGTVEDRADSDLKLMFERGAEQNDGRQNDRTASHVAPLGLIYYFGGGYYKYGAPPGLSVRASLGRLLQRFGTPAFANASARQAYNSSLQRVAQCHAMAMAHFHWAGSRTSKRMNPEESLETGRFNRKVRYAQPGLGVGRPVAEAGVASTI
jgi:hypothetical protein